MEYVVAWAQLASAAATVGLAVLTLFYVLATNRMAKGNDEMVKEMRDSHEAQDRANRETLEENRRMVEANSEMVEEMRAGRLAQERPLVVLDVDYSRIPMLRLVIRNIGRGAARSVRFHFRDRLVIPEEASPIGEGKIILSELPIFSRGIDFLAPGAEIPIIWGGAVFIIRDFYEKKIDRVGILLDIAYESLDGRSYWENDWRINPVDMEDIVSRAQFTEEDMIEAVTKAAKKIDKAVDVRNRLNIITASEKKREDDEVFKDLLVKPTEEQARESHKQQEQEGEDNPEIADASE